MEKNSSLALATIRFWNLRDNSQPTRTIRDAHKGFILSCDYSPTGQFVASGGDDSRVKVWSTTSGASSTSNEDNNNYITKFTSHTNKVYGLQFNSSGSQLVSASMDKSVRIWDLATSSQVAEMNDHNASVFYCNFSNTDDGKLVVSVGDSHLARIWDRRAGGGNTNGTAAVIRSSLPGHSSTIWSAKFSHDDTLIVTAGMDQTIRVWDLRKNGGDCLHSLHGHNTAVHHAVFSKNDKWIFSGARDQNIKCWDVMTGECVETVHAHSNNVFKLAVSPTTGADLLSCSTEGIVKLWSVASIGFEAKTVAMVDDDKK